MVKMTTTVDGRSFGEIAGQKMEILSGILYRQGNLAWCVPCTDILYRPFTPDRIKNVEFYPPATKVTFQDGVVITTTAQEGDEFDEYTGVMHCIMEYIFNGKKYNNMIRKWIKKAETDKKAKEKAKKDAEERKKIREHQRKKKAAKKLLKKQAYIEQQIEIQKEAYLRAMEEKERA